MSLTKEGGLGMVRLSSLFMGSGVVQRQEITFPTLHTDPHERQSQGLQSGHPCSGGSPSKPADPRKLQVQDVY